MPAPIITTVPSHVATMLHGNSEIRRLGKVTRNARLGILPESPCLKLNYIQNYLFRL